MYKQRTYGYKPFFWVFRIGITLEFELNTFSQEYLTPLKFE